MNAGVSQKNKYVHFITSCNNSIDFFLSDNKYTV